jgi:hypothetical protein
MLFATLKEQINWALTPFPNGITYKLKKTDNDSCNSLRNAANIKEKKWGNNIIGQRNNGNWTTLLGENLVYEVLKLNGANPRKPKKINGYYPDWETDTNIYEVKTRNWTTTGTAGEKVFGVMYKYSDIPILYEKPLKIVCVAYQEYELTHGNTKMFGDDISDNKKAYLDLARSQKIEYIKFSDLVSNINYE